MTILGYPRERTGSARGVRRAMLVYVLLGLAVLFVSGIDTYLAARAVARADALREAERDGATVADLMVLPVLTGVRDGDGERIGELDRAVTERIKDGSLLRIRVWDSSGLLIYADEAVLAGRRYPLPPDAAKALAEDAPVAQICDHGGPPGRILCGDEPLVEVYVPLRVDLTSRFVVEAYFGYAPVEARTEYLTRQMVLLIVAVLVALQVAQVPIAYSLARSVSRHQDERGQLLQRALSASERERRRIARDLHDGVIQDLAGASYVLSAVEKSLPEGRRQMVGKAGAAIQDAVSALRTVMVDIYPPDLAEGGLARAVDDLAEPLRDDGLDVRLSVDVPGGVPAAVVATLYRLAREALGNVAAHARANRVDVLLRREDEHVVLRVDDDGVGLPESGIDRRSEGHLGLRLLADSVVELGGDFRAVNRERGGTSIQVRIPLGTAATHGALG